MRCMNQILDSQSESWVSNQEQNPSVIPEDQKVTVRLLPIHPTDDHSDEHAGQLSDLYMLPSQSVYRDVQPSPMHLSDEPVSKIDLIQLSVNDQILIETKHSFYSFTISDPKNLSGKLIGGLLGNRLVDA